VTSNIFWIISKVLEVIPGVIGFFTGSSDNDFTMKIHPGHPSQLRTAGSELFHPLNLKNLCPVR
jgi:hypothetical protein